MDCSHVLFCFDFSFEAGFSVKKKILDRFKILEQKNKKMKLDHFVAHRLVPFCREQLMSNIVREWCKLSTSLSPTRVFIINDQILKKSHEGGINAKSLHQNDIETATNYYSNGISQWIGSHSTFGIVHRYFVEKKSHQDEDEKAGGQFTWQKESPYYNGISLVLCCAKEETLQLQQALTRQRHHWYRRLSKSPLNSGFKLNLTEEKSSSNNRINIVYQPKQVQVDGDVHLDNIILNSHQISRSDEESTKRLTENRDIIICQSNLDNVLGAFLDDAYTPIKGDSEQNILKLNPALVPFKLAFTFDEAELPSLSSSSRSRLNELATYLITSLQDYSDISIFPFVAEDQKDSNRKLLTPNESDQLAVQYCAILKAETLENGLIWLRNRDTRISETIHLSNFVKTMLFYLQPEKLINGGNFEQQQEQSAANAK